MVETGQNRDFQLRTARVTTPGLRKGPLRLKVCLKSEMGHVYKLGRDVEKLVDVVYKLGSSFGEVFGIGETDIQEKDEKQSQKRPNQARDGKDKVKSKPKSVKVRKSTKTMSKSTK
ncbi:hypothetical protein Tco_0138165 [Tanacetum coccineum]